MLDDYFSVRGWAVDRRLRCDWADRNHDHRQADNNNFGRDDHYDYFSFNQHLDHYCIPIRDGDGIIYPGERRHAGQGGDGS